MAMASDKTTASSNPFYEVVVKEEAPFVIAHRAGPYEKPVFSGLSVDLLKAVSNFAGFDYNIKLVNHRTYGYRNERGKWEGLISEIQNGVAKIAVGPIPRASNEDGNAIVDFTEPYMSTDVNLLVKYPQDEDRGMGLSFEPSNIGFPTEEERSIGLMFQPFKAEVWVMLCLAFIAVSLALFLIGRFSPFEWARQPAKDKEGRNNRKIFELKNSFFFAASTISLQGYKEAPRSSAGRFLACMWFMFVLCTLLAYTASLGSILVSRTHPPSYEPVSLSSCYEDLLDRKQVKLGGVKNTYVYTTLKASKVVGHGLLPKMFSYIDDNHEWIMNATEGIQRVQSWGGKYAMVMETVKSKHIARSRCDLMPYGESLFRLGYCFAVVKNSQLRERINTGISHFMGNGYIKQLEEKYLGKGACPDRDSHKLASYRSTRPMKQSPNSSASLDMKDMAVPFLFLFLGILVAGGVLAGEIYYKKKMATKKEPNDEKEREPLNTHGSKIIRAPKASPPPNPIVKVNNKLQEEKLSNKMDPPPPPKSNTTTTSVEVVIVNEKGKEEDDDGKLEDLTKAEKAEENTQNITKESTDA